MSFREKSAWISLLVTLGVYGVYFVVFVQNLQGGRGFGLAGPLGLCVAVLVGLQVAFQAVAAALSPADARTPEDERERNIHTAARTKAFFVLQAAALCAAITIYFADKWILANAVVGAMVLGEIAFYAGVVVGYRRGG